MQRTGCRLSMAYTASVESQPLATQPRPTATRLHVSLPLADARLCNSTTTEDKAADESLNDAARDRPDNAPRAPLLQRALAKPRPRH